MMQPLPSPRYYTDLPNNDDHHHDDEFDVSSQNARSDNSRAALMNDDHEEKSWAIDTEGRQHAHVATSCQCRSNQPRKKRRWMCKTIMSIRSLLDTVMLVVILVLVAERRWPEYSILPGKQNNEGAKGEIGGDITGFAPYFSQQITTFQPDPLFVPDNSSDFFTEAVRKKWLGIVPRGLGYVTVNKTSSRGQDSFDNLPHPLKEYPSSTFTTSVTHQIHCLHTIAGVVAAYESNRLDMLPEEGAWHLNHCFDYLRQSIMCCGDVALEGQHTTFPEDFTGSDGWDAKHVCRDYGEVLEYLEANRADDQVWI
ncbi:Putative protein of unknown function [Podospora comata]|uniref:Oxidase ustYa n=1 Tax=Podospora comata TaxID=48703 RepID=A0ABY6S043_PODCO|nr:Putative protein of unknown function [Podospora comata]